MNVEPLFSFGKRKVWLHLRDPNVEAHKPTLGEKAKGEVEST